MTMIEKRKMLITIFLFPFSTVISKLFFSRAPIALTTYARRVVIIVTNQIAKICSFVKFVFKLDGCLNSFLTYDDTRSFCGQRISRSDCTERSVSDPHCPHFHSIL